jgi:hypothetical protein
MHISLQKEEMEFVAKGRDIKDYISNNENVTEIKWDPFDDNISIPYKNFYKFINERLEIIYLFGNNAFLNDAVNKTTFGILFKKFDVVKKANTILTLK